MDGYSEAPCLGCSRTFRVPNALFKVAEKYKDGRIVLFCSRSCNFSFIEKEGRTDQEKQMKELLERLENQE